MILHLQTKIKEKFTNSIALSDDGLAQFFKSLKKRDYLSNSLVIITGDHGYTLGNHSIPTTEHGIYEESYRVPFLMVWPDQLTPKRITAKEAFYSHVDLAPTLIDLLRLEVDRHHLSENRCF